ncbi:hypothetical protein C8R47DRAFT_1202694, partial [Mycena vitilis]
MYQICSGWLHIFNAALLLTTDFQILKSFSLWWRIWLEYCVECPRHAGFKLLAPDLDWSRIALRRVDLQKSRARRITNNTKAVQFSLGFVSSHLTTHHLSHSTSIQIRGWLDSTHFWDRSFGWLLRARRVGLRKVFFGARSWEFGSVALGRRKEEVRRKDGGGKEVRREDGGRRGGKEGRRGTGRGRGGRRLGWVRFVGAGADSCSKLGPGFLIQLSRVRSSHYSQDAFNFQTWIQLFTHSLTRISFRFIHSDGITPSPVFLSFFLDDHGALVELVQLTHPRAPRRRRLDFER